MARDPYDHGREQIDCPSCHGKGDVVQPIMVWNHKEKANVMVWRSDLCQTCAGSGKVWA